MKIPSNICGDSNNGNNFPHNLLLTDIQVSKLLANNSSANIILSKTQLHKIAQPGKILGSILWPLLNPVLPIILLPYAV